LKALEPFIHPLVVKSQLDRRIRAGETGGDA
jgi:hypothetical protein